MRSEAYIQNIGDYDGKETTLKGWVYNKRSSGKIHFLMLRDGTGIIQCIVAKNDVSEDVFNRVADLTQESSVIIKGTVHADARAPGGYEIISSDVEILQIAEDYPITPKEHGMPFLMDHRHLWLRSKKQHAILRIRHEIIRACRDYFDGNGFTLIDAPIFTPAACEGTSTLFETEYFGESAYLTQSGQLYMEAGAMAFGKVYCFGPTFRAEKSKTRRHLTEFWMIEPEVAYADLDDNMELIEDFVSYVVQRVLKNKEQELAEIERDTSKLQNVKAPFPRLHYNEAVDILHKNNAPEFEWGIDFGGGDETIISEQFDKPVLVHRYPAQVKAFYMKRDPEDDRLSLSVDLLAPEGYGEVVGGGQREDDLETLHKGIHVHDLPQDAFDWYLDLRKYGTVPHSGFGLGIERTVTWLCGRHHVRETIPFPRLMHRLNP